MPAAKEGEATRAALLPDEVQCYIREHAIDQRVTTVLNDIIKQRPADPLGHLAEELAKRSSSVPCFSAIRLDAAAPRAELRFDVVVSTRGVNARLHSFSLGEALFSPEEPKEEEEGAIPEGGAAVPDEAEQQAQRRREWEAAAAFAQKFLHGAFAGVSVDDFLGFHERCEGLAASPAPGGFVVNVPRATAVLTDELLLAAARSLDATRLEFMQRLLSRRAGPGSIDLASPQLRAPDGLTAWRERWPRLAMPVFHGGGPSVVRAASLRCCAAFSPFVMAAGTEEDGIPRDCPRPGWISTTLQALRELGSDAAKELQKDKASAALAVDGVAHCVASLERTLELAQKYAEAAAGAGREAETSGVLYASAEEAWLDEEGVYEIETGKKLTLEQLVDLYDQLAKTGWLRMIVQPFRQADFVAGCEQLSTKRPDLRLVVDFGEEEFPPPPKGAAYSCALHLAESVPLTLERYASLALQWQEAGGCGRCTLLGARALAWAPSALVAALACREPEVILFDRDVVDTDVARLSERVDEVPYLKQVLSV